MTDAPDSSPSSPARPPSELEGLDPAGLLRCAQSSPGTGSGEGRWTPPTVEDLKEALPGYRVTGVLGRGGMGAVYEGEQLSLERKVAIKVLPVELGIDPEFEARFRREAKAMARLNHPSIVQIYDFGQTKSGHCYFIMEFVDGTDLHRLIREGRLDVTGALNAVSQICDALQYAHDEGFVHRDIKPANIFINRQGMVKVGDFGLAKLVESGESDAPPVEDLGGITKTGVAMGTLNYISPEQLTEGALVDRRSDIYSLGVMFYEMLTREVPRGALKAPSKRVGLLDARIDGVVFKAMDPDPSERYQTASELRTDVDVIRTTPPPEGSSEETPPPPPPVGETDKPPTAPHPAKRKRKPAATWKWPGIALSLLFFAALVLLLLKGRQREPSEAPALAPPREKPPVLPKEFAGVTREAPFANTLGMTFVPLPGTTLLICRHETRKQDYAAFSEAVGGRGDRWQNPLADGAVEVSFAEDHPVVNVTWEDAVAFCEWLSQKEGRLYRLPTDREWSIAAQVADDEAPGLTPRELGRFMDIPGPKDGRGNFADQSWQRTLPNRRGGQNVDDRFPTTSPVMSFPANTLGIFDLKGNVWEYCLDHMDHSREYRTLRGNCWNDPSAYWKSRTQRTETNAAPTDGFRCVLVAAEPELPPPSKTEFTAAGAPIRFGLSRYQLVLGASGWPQARAEAEKRGGHLAAFGTEAERDWALKHFPAQAPRNALLWLGSYGPSANDPRLWTSVTGESLGRPVWTGATSESKHPSASFHYAALASAGGASLSFTPIPASEQRGSGFLIEWEDIAEAPALSPAGTPLEGPFTNSLGMKFLPVPGSAIHLCIHETRKSDFAAFAAETPGLDGAWGASHSFGGVPVSPEGNHPVSSINWHEARAFCEWLSRREGHTYRLPTDREWSLAAEIGDFESPEALPADLSTTLSAMALHPWGHRMADAAQGAGNFFDKEAEARLPGGPRTTEWNYNDGFATTAPVMESLPNKLGFFDLYGNVREMCEDKWGGPEIPAWSSPFSGLGDAFRTARGMGWSELPKSLAERTRTGTFWRFGSLGFRVALVSGEEPPRKAPLAERTQPLGQPKRFGSSRYQYVAGTVTWGEARVRAEQMGGHLATLAFEPESRWVEEEFASMLKPGEPGCWIGLIFNRGGQWITGETLYHERWLPGSREALGNSSTTGNQAGGVLARQPGGNVGWTHQPAKGGGANAPGGFLVEWEDLDGAPLPRSTTLTPREPLTNSLGMRFIPVEGADILLCVHETRRKDYAAFAGEVPRLDQSWKAASLDGLPVSREDSHPVTMVNWHEARAFCDWLSRKEGRTYRLPTDREWSLAAGLGGLEDAATPPDVLSRRRTSEMLWGTAWPPPPAAGNFADLSLREKLPQRRAIEGWRDGFATSSPVMSFPPHRGFHDLTGNMNEWVEDRMPRNHRSRILRGGDWITAADLAATRRWQDHSHSRRFFFGFRCALDIHSAPPP